MYKIELSRPVCTSWFTTCWKKLYHFPRFTHSLGNPRHARILREQLWNVSLSTVKHFAVFYFLLLMDKNINNTHWFFISSTNLTYWVAKFSTVQKQNSTSPTATFISQRCSQRSVIELLENIERWKKQAQTTENYVDKLPSKRYMRNIP